MFGKSSEQSPLLKKNIISVIILAVNNKAIVTHMIDVSCLPVICFGSLIFPPCLFSYKKAYRSFTYGEKKPLIL
jgi:hypothetical protein